MSLKSYVLIGLVFFGVGFLVGWCPTFEIVKNYVIGGLSIGAVIEVGGLLFGIYKERTQQKLIHSEILINKNLRVIADKQINYANKHKFGLDIQVLPETQDDIIYSKDINSHLIEYPKVKSILNKRDWLIKEHNEQSNSFLEELHNKISNKFKQIIPDKWDSIYSSQSEPSHYQTRDFDTQVIEIIKHVQFFNETIYPLPRNPLSFSISREGTNKWKLSFINPLVVSDNIEELNELKKWIENTFNDSIKGVIFNKLKKYSVDIIDEHKRFIEEIFTIIKRVEYGIPLNGSCETCQKKWWEIW
jgi:hypothetical protein